MKKDETMGDLFDTLKARMAAAKGEAEKVRELGNMMMETCRRDDLTERSQLNQLAYLTGMATRYLRDFAGHIERGELDRSVRASVAH